MVRSVGPCIRKPGRECHEYNHNVHWAVAKSKSSATETSDSRSSIGDGDHVEGKVGVHSDGYAAETDVGQGLNKGGQNGEVRIVA